MFMFIFILNQKILSKLGTSFWVLFRVLGRRGGLVLAMGELGQHLNNFSHCGALDTVLLDAKRGNEEQVSGFIFGHRGQPPVNDLKNIFPSTACGFL